MRFVYKVVLLCAVMSLYGAQVPEAGQSEDASMASGLVASQAVNAEQQVKCSICWEEITQKDFMYFEHEDEDARITSNEEGRRHGGCSRCLMECFKSKLECHVCRAELPKDFKTIYQFFNRYLDVNNEPGGVIYGIDTVLHNEHTLNASKALRLKQYLAWCINFLRDNKGDNAFFVAIKTNDFRMIPFLLNHGCDISLRNTEGFTGLEMAVIEGNVELVGSLLLLSKIQGTINDQTDVGDSLLHAIVRNYGPIQKVQYECIIDQLISHGIDLTLTNNKGATALESLVYCTGEDIRGVFPLIQYLFEESPYKDKFKLAINCQNKQSGNSLLHALVESYHPERPEEFAKLFDLLVSNGIDVTLIDNKGVTALELAVIHVAHNVCGYDDFMRELSAKEYKENFKKIVQCKNPKSDRTLLHILVANCALNSGENDSADVDSCIEVANILIDNGVEITATTVENERQLTALQLAEAYGHEKLVECFLAKERLLRKHGSEEEGLAAKNKI